MLYRRLAQDLRRRIELGLLKPGDRLPGEFELVRLHGMSRTTVRLALGELERGGLVERRQGRGTYVRAPATARDVVTLASCERDIAAQGLTASLRVLNVSAVPASQEVATALGLEPRTKVTCIARLRLADGKPVCHDLTYLPLAIGERIDRRDLERERICTLLRRQFEISFSERRLTFRAASATARTAAHLGVAPSSPLFIVDICTYAELGWAVEFQRRQYPAERLSYVVRLADVENFDETQAQVLALDRMFA